MIWLPLCIALGAFLYRWRGGPAWLKAPRWLKLGACAAGLSLPAFLGAPWPLALAAFIASLVAISLGHGAYMDLAHTSPEKPHDRVGQYQEEPWLAWLRWIFPAGTIGGSRYWYEFLALGVTGFVATLPAGLALVLAGDWRGVLLAASGFLKAPAYAIGWRLAKGSRATEIGEWLTGAGMGLGVGLALG